MLQRIIQDVALCFASILLVNSPISAAELPNNAFSVELYQIPYSDLFDPYFKEGKTTLSPQIVAGTASETESLAFIREATATTRSHFEGLGLKLPTGSLAALDPEAASLALRTDQLTHAMLRAHSHAAILATPKLIRWEITVIEAATDEVRALVPGALEDAAAMLEAVRNAGRVVANLRGETKSGVKLTASSGPTSQTIESYLLDQTGLEAKKSSPTASTRVEMEPLLSSDGDTIDTPIAFTHREAALRPISEVWRVGNTNHSLDWPSQYTIDIKTSLSMRPNGCALIGIGVCEKNSHLRPAFLSMSRVDLIPESNTRMLSLLKTFGEKAEPTPIAPPPSPFPPTKLGMQVKSFRVPADFLDIGKQLEDASDPKDPFSGITKPKKITTAQSILENQGVAFPEGSYAIFVAANRELTVQNTKENLDFVEMFVGSGCCLQLSLISFQVEVIRTTPKLANEWLSSSKTSSDHSKLLEAALSAVANGQAEFLGGSRIVTKPGYRSEIRSGNSFSRGERLKAADNKSDVTAAWRRVELTSGIYVMADAVIGADNYSIDLNLELKSDYAPPTVMPPGNDGAPDWTFYDHQAMLSTTIQDGQSRIIASWKPTGPTTDARDWMDLAFVTVKIVPLTHEH
jgi:hypothetical protein